MRRRRKLGYATVAILKAIREGHTYGLAVCHATGLPTGTVYPTFDRLVTRGFVRDQWEAAATAAEHGRPRRRHYELTESGHRALVDALLDFQFLTARPGPPPPD